MNPISCKVGASVCLLSITIGSSAAEAQNCGGHWWMVGPAGQPFSVLARAAMAYDSARARTVTFGGIHGISCTAITREWDGAAWTTPPVPFGQHPPAAGDSAMVYDAARERVTLFGGGGTYACPVHGQTWTWDGAAWTLRSNTGPSPRTRHAMAYDAARERTVLFGGGSQSDTWEWDGAQWSPRSVTGPSPRAQHAMAYDTARGVVVLFGGESAFFAGPLGDTWEWDGTQWSLRAATGPSPRARHVMAYDAARGVVVLFGGDSATALPDQWWEWDGAAWTQRPATAPPYRIEAAAAYDSGRQRVIMYGGFGASTQDDTWKLGDATGVPASVAVQPDEPGPTQVGAMVTFSIVPSGAAPFTCRWRKDGVNLTNGGTISGADTLQLKISGVQLSDTGFYDAEVANGCGGTLSESVALQVQPPCTWMCYADCNGNCSLTIADFACFQVMFSYGKSYADCNQSGTVTIADFGCFQAAFVAGCG